MDPGLGEFVDGGLEDPGAADDADDPTVAGGEAVALRLRRDPADDRGRTRHDPGAGLLLRALVGDGLVVGRVPPVLIGLEHAGAEGRVVLVEGIDEQVFPLPDLPNAPQHGVVLGRQPLQRHLSRTRAAQVVRERVRGEVARELHLGGSANGADVFGRQGLEVGEHVVGQGPVRRLERVDLPRHGGLVRVFARQRFVVALEPCLPARVGRACAQPEALAVGVLDGAGDGDVDRVGRARHHAHGAPVARGLQEVLQEVRHVVALGAAHFGLNVQGDLLVVLLGHVRIEHRDADVEQQLLGDVPGELLGGCHVDHAHRLAHAAGEDGGQQVRQASRCQGHGSHARSLSDLLRLRQ